MIEDNLKKQEDIFTCTLVGIVFIFALVPLLCCWGIWVLIRIFYYIGCGVLNVPLDDSMKFHDDRYTSYDQFNYRLEYDYNSHFHTPASKPPEKPKYVERGHISSP